MANKKTEEKVFHSMEEIIKEYLPGSLPAGVVGGIERPYNLGVILAQTDVKEIENMLKIKGAIVHSENSM